MLLFYGQLQPQAGKGIVNRGALSISEFLQLDENIGYFLRHVFFSKSWNNGILERWNSEFSKDGIHFKLYRHVEFCHLPNIAVSQDPFPQYSIIPPFQLGRSP
jgi:hypothetical protein